MRISLRRAIDELGVIRAEIAHLKELEAQYRYRITRAGFGYHSGLDYTATVYFQERSQYDERQLRQHVDPEILARCIRKTPTTCVLVRENERLPLFRYGR